MGGKSKYSMPESLIENNASPIDWERFARNFSGAENRSSMDPSFPSKLTSQQIYKLQNANVSFSFNGTPEALFETMKIFFPQSNNSAIINQLKSNQEATMAAFETIDAKLNQVATAIATEATEVKTEIDKLKELAANDRITPEQLATISTRFDGIIASINGIVTPTPATEAPAPTV
jgi:hypothetical protein